MTWRSSTVVVLFAASLACGDDPPPRPDASAAADASATDRSSPPDAREVEDAGDIEDARVEEDAEARDATAPADATAPDAVARDDAAEPPRMDAAPREDAAVPTMGDECAAIVDLDARGTRTGAELSYSGSTATAAFSGVLRPPSCLPEIGHPAVHRYTPRVDGPITVTLNDPATLFDTVAWVLDTCTATAAELACNDNGDAAPRPLASTIALREARAGVPIDIAVAGFRTAPGFAGRGPYRLSVREVSLVPPGGTCDPRRIDDLCDGAGTCVAITGNPSIGRCEAACDFDAPRVCPAGTECNGRAGTPGTTCVPAVPLGGTCDPTEFLPITVCAPPNNCLPGPGRCTAPAYVESTIASPTFIDACALGTVYAGIGDLDDGNGPTLPLPFTFELYGVAYDAITISTNGYAVLGTDVPSNATFGPPSPSDGAAIAGLWDDLVLDQAGARICTYAVGDRFVVEWYNAYRARFLGPPNNPMRLTFEIVLDGSNDTIDVVYQTLTPTTGPNARYANGLDARIGVQAPFGSDWTIHSGRVSTREGLRFTPR